MHNIVKNIISKKTRARLIALVILLCFAVLVLAPSAYIIFHASTKSHPLDIGGFCENCFNIPCFQKHALTAITIVLPSFLALVLTLTTILFIFSFINLQTPIALKVRIDN